jgi:tetratricopeptide (TPR) repeat protein
MQLSLSLPEPWQVKHAPGNRHLAILPGADGKPDLIVTFGALTLLPDEQRPWIEQTLASDVPSGARIKLGRSLDAETDTGWPMRIVEAQVLAPRSDDLIEHRVCAFYAFLEHAGVAMVRAGNRARLDAAGPTVMAMFGSARPDWSTPGQPASLADFWNLEPTRARPRHPRLDEQPTSPDVLPDSAELLAALEETEARLSDRPSARLHMMRGRILGNLGRTDDATEAFRQAASLEPASPAMQHSLGVALASLGKEAEAIAAWDEATRLDPELADAHYNAAQARYNRKQYEPALAGWRVAFELDPRDFLTLRKVVQCLYALDRLDEAQAVRGELLELWRSSSDPRARLIREYVFDQFPVGPLTVHAYETVQPRDPSFHAIVTFRVVDQQARPVPLTILVETSDASRQAGTPFVVAVVRDGQYRALATLAQMPPYRELKQMVTKLVTDASD